MKTSVFSKFMRLIALASVMIFVTISLQAAEKTQIVIKVTDSNNRPISGVIASLRKSNSINVVKNASSVEGEQITLDKIKKGKYVILITKGDFSNSIVATFEIKEIEEKPVEISVIFKADETGNNFLGFARATLSDLDNCQKL